MLVIDRWIIKLMIIVANRDYTITIRIIRIDDVYDSIILMAVKTTRVIRSTRVKIRCMERRYDNIIRDLCALNFRFSNLRAVTRNWHFHYSDPTIVPIARRPPDSICLRAAPLVLAIIANKRGGASLTPGHRSIITPIPRENEKLTMGFPRADRIQRYFSLTTASAIGIHVAASISRARTQVRLRRTSETGREMPRLASPVIVDVAAALGRIVPQPPLCLPADPQIDGGDPKTLTSRSFPCFGCA